MEKHLHLRSLKITCLFIFSFLVHAIKAQDFGEIIPYTIRDTITVRGDMTVIGNSVLGIRGRFENINYGPNDAYDGSSNNGRSYSLNNNNTFNTYYTRAYIDIDSDPNFNGQFSNPLFLSNTDNTDYGGSVNNDGTPTSASNVGTFSSSGASLNIDPTCAVVQRAFLYWSAVYPSETVNFDGGGDGFQNLANNTPRTSFGSIPQSDYTEVKILPPGGDQYYNISIDPANAGTNPGGLQFQTEVIVDGLDNSFFNNQSEINAENREIADREIELGRPLSSAEIQNIRDNISVPNLQNEPYVCIADVTELFTTLQDSGAPVAGFWTVANVRATTGFRRGGGLTGGWTLAVIYEENVPTAREQEISFFDGFASIRFGEDAVSFDSPQFSTIPDGPVNAAIATASLEGDRSFVNDQFSIETATTRAADGNGIGPNQLPDAARPLRENSAPDNTNNFFNSTITDFDGNTNFKTPNSSNTLGYDTDHFELPNAGNSILDNRGDSGGITDTGATFWLSTDSDSYVNFFTGFAVEVIAPNVQVTKTAFDRFGNELTSDSEIDFEDLLTYELEVRNIGNDVATNIILEDLLPVNTIIIPGVTEIVSTDFALNTTIAPNTTSIDRNTGLEFLTTLITIPIPDLTPLGDCAPGDANCRSQVIITLRNVGVIEECDANRNACIDRIENVALTSFRGVINTRPINQRDSFFRFQDGCDNLEQGPTVTLANRIGQCESQEAVICEDEVVLTAGLGFNTYQWFRIDNPTDQNGNGFIDDADYGVDANGDDRVSRAELEAQGAVFILETTGQIASPTSPGPNQLEVDFDDLTDTPDPNDSDRAKQPALYIVIQEAPNPCLQGLESFNVTVFDPLDSANNPFKDGAGNPILDGTVITPQCSIRNDLEITQFIVCSDGTPGSDSFTFPIPSGYPSDASVGGLDTNIVVSRFVEGSCTRDENSCPFIATPEFGNCNYTDVVTTTASASNEITLSETGSYRYVATIPGGCTITVYINVVILRNNVSLQVPTVGVCENEASVTVQGLPTLMDIPNRANTSELLYVLRFFENTGPGFDEATATPVLIQDPLANSGETGFFADSSDYGNYTINRPGATGEQTIEILVRATPIITGSVADTTVAPLDCPGLLSETVTFLDIEIEEFRFLREPTCGIDDPITSEDDTTADIIVTATAGSPQYIFQLIDTSGANDVVQVGPTTDNQEVFNNVLPGIPYKVRVIANGESANPIPPDSNCVVESEIIQTDPEANIEATLEIVKALDCEPAQLRVTLSAPGNPGYDLSSTSFEILELNTLGGTGMGRVTHFLIDDISNQPAPGDENTATNASVIFADLANITEFTVRVSGNASCVVDTPVANSLTPFDGLRIEETNVTNVRCNGESNGSFTVEAFENTPGNNPYLSPLADANNPTELVYEVVTATPNDVNITIDPNLIDRQNSPVFAGLPAGEYVVRSVDITRVQAPLSAGDPCLNDQVNRPLTDSDNNGLTDCEETSGIDDTRTPTVAFPLISECPSEEITIIITEPTPLIAPVLEQTQPTCEPLTVSEITIQDLATIIGTPDSFGGTQEATFDYTFTLFNTQGTADVADDTNAGAVQGSNNLPLTGIAEGTYRLEIEDANGCTVASTNEVTINPTAIVTFATFTPPVLDCDPATTDITETTATITVNATATEDNASADPVAIEGYRIIEIDGLVLNATTTPALETDFSANPSGTFADLGPGEYVIEASTVASSCRETLRFTIEPLNRIDVTTPNVTNVVCFEETNGQVSFSVSRFNPAEGFSYTLTRTGVTGAIQQDAGPLTSTLPITLTGLDANDLTNTTDEYTLTVTDLATSCFEAQTFRVLEPASLPSFTTSPLVYDCVANVYEFTVTPTGGSGTGFEFSLDNFATVESDTTIEVAPGATYTISLRDDAGCMAMPPLTNTAPTPTPLTASLNPSASNLCLPNTTANPISIVLDVTGTDDFRYRLSTETTFTDTQAVGGQIIITNPPTVSGNYTYEILDDNFNELSCGVTVDVTINDVISTTTPIRPVLDCNATSGNLPTSGEFVEFTTSGGTGVYVYTITEIVAGAPDSSTTFTTDATSASPGTADITTPAPSTNTTPRIQFSPNLDDRTFQIEVSDSAMPACSLPTTIEFTVNYPEAPEIASVTATTIDCFGDDAVITINPVLTGSQTLNSFEYSFDDGATFQNGNSTTVNLGTNLSQTFNTRIRNVVTGCVSINNDAIDDITITQPVAIIEDTNTRMVTQVTCTPGSDPTMPTFNPGEFTTTFTGGVTVNSSTPPLARSGFTFQLFDNNDIGRGVLQELNNQPNRTITFSNLDIGEYSIVIIDANGCRNENPIIFNINPTPEIEIIDSFFDPIDCVGGVDLYFEVRGGSQGPNAADFFRIGNVIGGATINPSAPFDNIQRFGNPDFPFTETLPAGAASFDPDRLFRIRGIDFNTPVDIFIEDSATGCTSSIQRFTSPPGTPPVDFISVIPTNTGDCNNNSGAIDVTFDVTDPASVGEDFEVDVFRVFDNQLLTPTPILITNAVASGNVVPQITGLPAGELRVRVKQVSGGSECSNSQLVNIGVASPLTGPSLVNNLSANCDMGAQFEVRAQGGTPDYAFRLVRTGDPAPNTNSNFPLSENFEIDPTDPIITLGTFPDNRIGTVDVYVRDFNGCISGPLALEVRDDPSPILSIDPLGVQECGDGPFTANLTINDYDANQTYTFAINGQPAQNLPLTETAPGVAVGSISNITSRGNFDVVVVGSAQPTCTTTDSFTIFEQLVVDLQLSQANCSPNLERAEVMVTGGFETVPTRSLVYELFEGTNPTAIAMTTSTNTFIQFRTGENGVTLVAGRDYRVVVTDRFDSTATTLRFCTAEDTDSQRATILPVIEVATTDLTCPDDAEGVITISRTTNGDTPPISFELYSFANTADAEAAIAAGNVRSVGTFVPVTSGNNTFENLQGESQAVYVPLAIATANNCEVLLPGATNADRVVSLSEPLRSVEADFRVTPTDGVCNNIDPALNSSATIRVEVLASAPTANYTFTIPGRITNAPITGGDVTIEVDSNPTNPITYQVIISDGTLTTCDPITIEATVAACPEPIIPPDPLIVGEPNAIGVNCLGDTNGSVTINISPANGRTTVNYTYSITGGTPSITRNSAPTGTTNPVITETGLNPGLYSITINDLDEPTSAAIIIPNAFEITTPTSAPDFTLVTPLPYNCSNNTVAITANPVANSGTPGYTFELDDLATAASPDFTSVSGSFTNVPAPAIGSGTTINYQVTIEDANGCRFSRPIDVMEQPQLNATIAVPNNCLPNGTTTTEVSVRVDIISGTAPFEFARVVRTTQADPIPASPATFNSVANNANFFIDNTITNAGFYNYYLRDANGCVFVTPDVEIYDAITLVTPPVLTPPTCDITSTTTPQARNNATYEFEVTGGNTANPFIVEIREGASATTLGNFQPFTGNFPVTGADAFVVTEAQDGRFFQFRVTDSEGCSLLVIPPFSFDFPDSPSATADNPVYFCDGETGTATVTVTGGTPPYEYSYDGGTFAVNQNTFTSTAGIFDYIVRDANGCTFRSTLAIEDNSIENDGDPRITNISCSAGMPATNSGEISIDIVGGTPNYTFTIISQSTGLPVTTATQTPANPVTVVSPFTVTFSDLEADTYDVQVTDANNCTVREFADLEVETISPIDISTPVFIDECETGGINSGITVVFSIDGAVGPFTIRSFTESRAAGMDVFVVPSDPSSDPSIIDDVSRFGDTNFPSTFTLPPGTPVAVSSTFYAVSNLNYGETVSIQVIDANTSCPQNTNFTTPESTLVEITLGDQLAESECVTSPDDGEQALTFQRLSGSATDYDVVLLDPVTGTVINLPGVSPQIVTVDATGLGTPLPFVGLDEGNYQVRVTERRGGASTLCGDIESFTIERAVALEAPTVNSNVIVDCNSDPATFTIQVSATGGRLPYSFIARLAIDPAPMSADFIANGVPGPTVAVDYSTGTDWVLYVMDNSTCGIVSTPFTITEQPDPILDINPEFSVDQCEGENRFRIGVTITNYDPAFAPYTFSVGTTGGTLITQTLVLDPAANPSIAGPLSGQLEVSTRGVFDVEVANNNGCTDLEMITIFPELDITATLPEAIDCDGQIPSISATVTGGFGSGTLTYDLVNAGLADSDPNFILNTLTSTSTNITFTSNMAEGALGTPTLATGIEYAIRVTDAFGATAGAPTCSSTSNVVSQPVLQRTELIAPTVTPPTCNAFTDGSVRINVNSANLGDDPIFELYSFATLADAQNAVANINNGTINDPTAGGGTLITTVNAADPQLFENIGAGFYADFVSNSTNRTLVPNCYLGNTGFEIVEPAAFDLTGITVTAVQPRCDNPQQDAQLVITIDLSQSTGTAPYFFRLDPAAPFVEIEGTDSTVVPEPTITLTVDVAADATYDVQFRDSGNITCPGAIQTAPSVTVNPLINPIASVSLDTTRANAGSYSCTNGEAILISLDNAEEATDYTFTVLSQPAGSALATTPSTVSSSGASPAPITAVQPFDLSVPGFYEFEVINVATGCSTMVEHRFEEVEQLSIRVLPLAELNCEGDDAMLSFEIIDYSGFLRYTIVNDDATPVVVEDAIVDTTTGIITPITPAVPATPASFDTATNVLVSAVAFGVDNYTITVTATSDDVPNITSTNSLCTFMQDTAVVGPTVPLAIDSLESTSLTCTTPTATITATAVGGTFPYTFTLTGGSPAITPITNQTGIFTNIDAGDYVVSVVDVNGCITGAAPSVVPTIDAIEPMPVFELSSAPVACAGDLTSITVGISGAETVTIPARLNSRNYALIEVADIAGNNPSAPLATQSNNLVFDNVRPGVNGQPRFFRVAIIDNFGCTAMSNVVPVEAPMQLIASNLQTIAIDCETSRPGQGGLETAQFEISISGGTAPFTYTTSANSFINGVDPSDAQSRTSNVSTEVYELRPGRHFFRIRDNNGCESFTRVDVGPAPAPIEFDLSISSNTLCPNVLGFVDVDGPIRGGSGGPVFELWVVDGANEVQINDGAPIASVNHVAGSSLFTGLPDVRITPPAGISATSARYEYRVSTGTGSAMCTTVTQQFDITQFPSVEFSAASTAVSCEFEEDATITVDLDGGLVAGAYTVLLIKEEGIDRSSPNFANGATTVQVPLAIGDPTPINPIEGTIDQTQGIALSIQVTNPASTTNSVTFENLAEGDYTLIISTPTGCIPMESFITVAEKEPFTAVFQDLGNSPDCDTDAPGTRTYTLEGGTPPYYYAVINLDNLEEQPDVDDIFGVATNRVDVATVGFPQDVTISGPSASVTFENNVNYQIFFVDSGNGMIAPLGSTADIVPQAGFNACELETAAFEFDVPDLNGFTTIPRYICETGLYNVTVSLPVNSELEPSRITYTIVNTTTGEISTSDQGNNTIVGVSPGDIVTTIEYERPDNGVVCNSTGPDGMVEQTLEDFSGLSFVRQQVLDQNGNPILDANGNNTGLPYELIGLNEYRISAQGGLPPYTFEVSNGQDLLDLEIDLRGRASFTITESAVFSFTVRDANGCIAFSTGNSIGFIDIEIPNVFNPASSNDEVNRWYPDNLTLGDVFPIPPGGIVVEEGSTVITVTTGGVTTGGTITNNNDGTITITGGTTTGGITIVTTINPDGETTSMVTVNTGGTLVGGTVTGVPTITSDGETTIENGTVTGGIITGGVTSSPIDTGVTATSTSTTVIRTTFGNPTTDSTGETTGGVFIETTTVPGPNNTTITTARVIDLTTSGSVTGGTPIGSIVVGGSISGGIPLDTNLPVETTTSGGTTINAGDDFIDFRNIEVMIFDRYGRLLETFVGILDNNDGWDGTYQGKQMPTGDYWYLIKLNDSRGREISGHFTLYRSK